ncbi:ComF family protein [Sphingobium sp. OAS761]|uniref:ComF family protein n=1 Tax=Sphingobium sp. OAS761 TaxID=2817901 RepID=UPI00209CD39B|nr:ComF family protein [Sphingobium sp. OAS761]MCP1471653.1 ComF family protein [Sphingobium sp. OAS761]
MMPLVPLLKAAIAPAVDFALPPRCPGCGAIVAQDLAFCLACWDGMEFLSDPCCARCGLPFPHEMGPGAECARCIADPPPWDGARAVLAYGDIARTVALRLKYGRRIGLARLIARHMVRHVPDGVDDPPVIVPVPLHRWRLWNRGFNQSALIADHLARITGLPVDRHALRRVKRTRPLRGMNPKERDRAVRGAFALTPTHGLAGRRVLLIDDVHTSGATAAACARALRRGGVRHVTLLCWARALPHDGPD